MKIFLKMVFAASVVLFVGCGGGGGNPGGQEELVYKGETALASLDKNETQNFLSVLNTSYADMIDVPGSSYNKIAKKTSLLLKRLDKKANGATSGSVDMAEKKIDNVTRQIIAIFKNFNDGDEETLDGKVTYVVTVDAQDSSFVKKMSIKFDMFRIKDGKTDIVMDGLIDVQVSDDGKRKTLIQNLVAKNNQDNTMMKFEDLKIVLNEYDREVSYEGRIYYSEAGYIQLSTPVELTYDESGNPMVGGEILYEGKDTTVKVRTAYDNRVRVEIDNGKDGTVNDVQVYQDGDFEHEIPNAAPVISITFPQSIYTDTDMSAVSVTVYDPDLDGFTSTYEWKVNDAVQSDVLELANDKFVKHDRLKLTVVATDDRAGDVKSATQSKEQEVLNSAPKIVLEVDKTTIEVGDKIVFDASKSYDVDGDTFSYKWNTENRQYNIYDESYNMGQTYLDINDSNKSIISFLGEAVNYYYLNYSVKPYGVKIILDDGDTQGISELKSEDIVVNVMDVFNREVIILKNKNISTSGISAIDISDINNDGLKDIIIVTDTYGENKDNGKLIILLQDNTHKFTVLKKIILDNIAPYSYNSVSVSDLNSDGFQDIAYTSPTMKGFNVFYQDSDGNFIEEKEYFTKNFPHVSFPAEPDMIDYISNSVDFLTSGDMNKDGKKDIITIGSNSMTSGSTGMNIFLQNDINLSDSKMLALDNRTIEYDGQYQTTDSHKIENIHTQDVDEDGNQDIIVANYVEYQEDNGSYSEVMYGDVDFITFVDFNKTKKLMIGVNTFDKNMLIYDNTLERIYTKSKTVKVLVPNPNQSLGFSIKNTQRSDIIIGHDSWPYFTMFSQKGNGIEFYGDQIFKLSNSDSIGYSSLKESLIKEDMNNDGKDDIIFLGNEGFEVFYTK